MFNKKGQAALEFLTTYGWAFLVILVMIGALAYFGVLDPTRFLPQRCQFGAEMHCNKFALDQSSGGAYFALTNALPTHVTVSQLEWSTPDDSNWYTCESVAAIDGVDIDVADPGVGTIFNRESNHDFVCEDIIVGGPSSALGMDTILIAGDKQRLQIRVTYNEGVTVDPAYAKYIYGEIYANIRE